MQENILIVKKNNVNLSRTVKLEDFIDYDNIKKNDFLKPTIINDFIISKKENFFCVEKSYSFNIGRMLNIISLLSKSTELQYILMKYISEIKEYKSDKKRFFSSIERLVAYLYLEVLLLVEISSYKHNNNIDYSFEKNMIKEITKNKIVYSKKTEKENSRSYKRNHIAHRSKNSAYCNKFKTSRNVILEIKKICFAIGLQELEIPNNYNKDATLELLKSFEKVLTNIQLKNRNFSLRFKKIAHYKKTGLFIKNENTLIVDPRNTTTLFHELGHFIYENKCSIDLFGNFIDSDNIEEVVNKNKKQFEYQIINHKIEELNQSSEIFAYYFEERVKDFYKQIKINVIS